MRKLRSKLTLTGVAALLLLVLVVCVDHVPSSVMSELEHADQYELLSLDPQYHRTPPEDSFHGWRVLGRTSVTDPESRKSLNRALRFGAWEAGLAYRCFNPRHGVHLLKNGKSVDLVICFQCRYTRVFYGTQLTDGFGVSGSQQEV